MDFIDIFVNPPGDLLYFIIVVAISLASLLMILGQRMHYAEDRVINRYTFALVGVVMTWALLLAGSMATLFLDVDPDVIIPPLERMANTLTIVFLTWAFLTADHDRWGRLPSTVLAAMVLLVGIAYGITTTRWINLADVVDFNISLYGTVWAFTPFVVTVFGLILTAIYFNLIHDAPLKFVFFLLLVIGYGGTLWQINQGQLVGDYTGLARLSTVAAMGVTLALIYRVVTARLTMHVHTNLSNTQPLTVPSPVETNELPPAQPPAIKKPSGSPIERESVQLLRALGLILENATPESVPTQVVNAILDILKADIGALLRLQDANYADITSVYDRSMKRSQSGISLNLDNQPTLVNAIERRSQRPLFQDRNLDELEDLYARLDIGQIGPVYFQPLVHDDEIVAVLMVALPYTNRELNYQEEEILKGVAVIAAGLLALSYQANDASLLAEERAIQAMVQGITPGEVTDENVLNARQEMQASLQVARDQIAELSKQVMTLKLELDRERSRVVSALGDSQEGLSISQRITAIHTEQHTLREERDQLAARLQEAEAALVGASDATNDAMLAGLVNQLEQERDHLAAERNRLTSQLEDLRTNEGMVLPDSLQNVVERMSDEKARLETERNQLQARLGDIHEQLKVYGIDGSPEGLAQLISQLYEQRASIQAQYTEVLNERDTLLMEREKLQSRVVVESERETRIETLQNQIKHLASDRETLTRQRDQYRRERDEVNAKLESVKQHRTRLWAQSTNFEMELKESQALQAQLKVDVQKLADERSDLYHQISQAMAQKQALETERDQLLARLEGDRERIQQIGQDGVGSLQSMIAELSGKRNLLEHELNQARATIVDLESRLEVTATTESDVTLIPDEQALVNADLLMGLVQELRTPMTAIIGYIDLLLSESVGILGEMQRRFLQRVSSNTTRLSNMLDDLARVTQIDTGHLKLEPVPVDVIAVIDDAITRATMQFREKGLTVNMHLENGLPHAMLDRAAVSQIFGQLLSNAYLVSPPESEVIITATRSHENLTANGAAANPVDCIHIAIEDSGVGVTPEDEADVFARRYRAENPLIEGLGDTGVGLSIARALVEAHHGKLWLESQPDVGSVFHVLLPLNAMITPEV